MNVIYTRKVVGILGNHTGFRKTEVNSLSFLLSSFWPPSAFTLKFTLRTFSRRVKLSASAYIVIYLCLLYLNV